jgi:hypothetical protein
MRYVELRPGAWDRLHETGAVSRSARNSLDDPGFAEVDDDAAETLIAEGLADLMDISYPAVRLTQPFLLPGRDLSDESILRVIDGVDVPEPMSFALTEAEFLLEQITTFRSRHTNLTDEEFREWMRTQPEIAHLADAEFPEPVPFIGRWLAVTLVRNGWAEPLSADELGSSATDAGRRTP